MRLDKLGSEMHECGLEVLLHICPTSGIFLADVMRGNSVELRSSDFDLTQALRGVLPEGSVDKIYCGWSIEDVLVLEPALSPAEARQVLEILETIGDASIGFAWDTLLSAITQFKRGREQPA